MGFNKRAGASLRSTSPAQDVTSSRDCKDSIRGAGVVPGAILPNSARKQSSLSFGAWALGCSQLRVLNLSRAISPITSSACSLSGGNEPRSIKVITHCVKYVPKVCQNAMFFEPLGLALSEKQIPQVNENTEEEK
ncbi:MAG: hypothetical protein ACYDCE_15970 [Candidatus Acidiferrales bacterium]